MIDTTPLFEKVFSGGVGGSFLKKRAPHKTQKLFYHNTPWLHGEGFARARGVELEGGVAHIGGNGEAVAALRVEALKCERVICAGKETEVSAR